MATAQTNIINETAKSPTGSSYQNITFLLSKAEIDPDNKLNITVPEVKAWVSGIAASNITQGEQIGAIAKLNEQAATDLTKLSDLMSAIRASGIDTTRRKILEDAFDKILTSHKTILKSSDVMHESRIESLKELTEKVASSPDEKAFMESQIFSTKNQIVKSKSEQTTKGIDQLQKDIHALFQDSITAYRSVYNPDSTQPHPATFEGAVERKTREEPVNIMGPAATQEKPAQP